VVPPRKDAPENLTSNIEKSQSANTPPRKKTTLALDLNNSISSTEQRKLARKWNYIKAIIDDIQHALKENPDSITTATLLEESSEELQQILQGSEVSVTGLIPMLKKLANDIRNQNLDRETAKREKFSNLTNELNSLNESYEQYKEMAKQCKRELEMHDSKLERVVRRRQLHDIKILDQLDKIEKIKFELAEAEAELVKLESNRYDFLEEEDALKEQSNATKLELGDIMKRIDIFKENVHRVNFQIENLDEAIDLEFDTRSNMIQDLVEILLNLEVI
jgi:chromosome segregation ATPase